jgi:hypothetical protein
MLCHVTVKHLGHQAFLLVQRIYEDAAADCPAGNSLANFDDLACHIEADDNRQRHLDAWTARAPAFGLGCSATTCRFSNPPCWRRSSALIVSDISCSRLIAPGRATGRLTRVLHCRFDDRVDRGPQV